jgi:phospholipase C
MMDRRCLPIAVIVFGSLLAACGGTAGSRSSQAAAVPNAPAQFPAGVGPAQRGVPIVPDRIIIIVMENHSFDDIIGATNPNGTHLLAPFLTNLSENNRLATLAFGVTHPSLGNYLSLLSGNSFSVHNDNGSCFAQPPVHPCYGFNKKNLIDSLEAAGISWESYNQSMPNDGFLGQQYPNNGDGLYRQKHDPFVYFKDIATNSKRLKHIKTFKDLDQTINNGVLPRFSFIVPDECHDMHGSVPYCPGPNGLIQSGDKEVQQLVEAIVGSGSFTQRSLMFVTFDEGGNSNQGCCDSPPILGGGHLPTIVIAGVPGYQASAQAYNEYSLLATVETLWNLPLLGYTSDTQNVKPMLDLIPQR